MTENDAGGDRRALALQPHAGDPRILSHNLVQIMHMLQLYQAELARILGLRCADVAALAQARRHLDPDSPAWPRACRLVRCYQALYARCGGDAVAMYHWLHRELPGFGVTPHRLLVDGHALAEVLAYLENPDRV